MRKIVFLVHGQRIHVGAQSDRSTTPRARATNDADDTRLADTGMMLDAECSKFTRDDLDGAMLLETEFGMRVEVSPQCGQFGVVAAQLFDWAHANRQSATAGRSMRSRGSTA
jgi:hypothetical protein